MSYFHNGEQTFENQSRDVEMRQKRPDLHALSYDGEISWLFLPVDTDARMNYTVQEISRLPCLENCAIGMCRSEPNFNERFWSYNMQNLNTNRETEKISIHKFITLDRYHVIRASLGLIDNWQEIAGDWTCQTDPELQFCLAPKIWSINYIHFTPEWLRTIHLGDRIVGKNLADDTICEDLDESHFFN
jgi:hypothetical protein